MRIQLRKGTNGTMKQVMPLNNSIEYECLKGRTGNKGKLQVFELLKSQKQLKHDVEELTLLIKKKDAEIDYVTKSSHEGPSSDRILRLKRQNDKLTSKV